MPSRMYLSPTGVRTTSPPAASTALLQAAVRQDGHDKAARQGAPIEPLQREDAEDLVAVDDASLAVDRDQAVGVAIEREPDVRATLDDHARERRRRGRPAIDVDVDPVGFDVDRLHPGAGRLQDRPPCRTTRAVRSVEDDMQPIRSMEPARPRRWSR